MNVRAVFNYAVCLLVLRICQGCIWGLGRLKDSKRYDYSLSQLPSPKNGRVII